MKADLTRDTFDPLKHFTRVLMQQGRVQVDADWNEQSAILLRYLRALAADLIGDAGGPAGNCAFGLATIADSNSDFMLSPGRYYVDGILCEIESAVLPIQQPAGFALNEVEVPSYVLDGVAFATPDPERQPWVEIGNDSERLLAQIVSFDVETRKLTLHHDVSSIAKAPGARMRRVVTYLTQPDYSPSEQEALKANTDYLVYLDVWERLVTCVEDDSIREVALNGVDTAARAQLVWQVKLAPGRSAASGQSPCDNFTLSDASLLDHAKFETHGRLRAMAKKDALDTDPCLTPPQVQYRGVENQLYRVEVHQSGVAWDGSGKGPPADAASFKWSRENGSVSYAIRSVTPSSSSKTTLVVLADLGRDERFGLEVGDWVELCIDDDVLRGVPRPLLQLAAVDAAHSSVTLTGLTDAAFAADPARHPLLRRWDHKQGAAAEGGLVLGADGAALVVEDAGEQWLELEDGVRIQFQPSDNPKQPFAYQSGDYWLIPARVVTGDVEWPSVTDPISGKVIPLAQPPKGIVHHYAPLGVVHVTAQGQLAVGSCRKTFSPAGQRPSYDYVFGTSGIGVANLALRAPARRRKTQPK